MSSYIESLKHLLAAKDHRVALIDHFAYLADTPGTEALLEDLFQQAQKVLIDRCEEWQISTLVIQFENGRELIAQEGLIIDSLCGESWPGSYKTVAKKHSDLTFQSGEGMELSMGYGNTFQGEYLNDPDRDMDESPLKSWLPLVGEKNDILSPAMTATHWWLYHPTEKNSRDEPAIYSFSHSDGLKPLEDFNVGALFLRYALDILL